MAANFVVQILIVRYLSKSDYGAFAYALSLISLGSSLAVFGFDKAITRFVPMYQEKGEYHKVIGAIIMMVSTVFSLSFFLVLLVFGLRGWITETFVSDQSTVQLLLLLVFLIPIQALDSIMVGMLAIFSKPSSIFFRRYVLGPSLKLLVVLLLILFRSNVYFLSTGYIASGALGITIYYGILVRDLRKQELWKHFNIRKIKFPIKEIFGFSTPLLTSNFVFMIRSQLVIILLQYFRSTLDVAAYRAVQPVADLNTMVIQSFGLLFMPAMARMFARKDQQAIDDLYWQSAVWITVISFPIFLLTFSLAQPLTLLLFGERYAQSGWIMAVLAFGYYFNAALGFNADTLRIYGRLRYTVIIDFIAMLISLALGLILIPRYGATGAAIGTCGTLILYNVLNHLGLKFATKINLFQWRYLRVYLSIVLGTLGLTILQSLLVFPIYIGVGLAGLISLIVLFINRKVINIEQTFPELLRFQLVRILFATKSS
ncbi:MAG: oligosaccharide flippase family protein [Bacteroidia bacterium]|nr:oligosaccharide flippase family protein [Bacteroidia bacterium]